MVKRTMLIAALAAVCGVAFADSLSEFKDRLRASYTLMEQGSTEKAVSELRDLQIDQPDSDLVAYSLATAKYKQGLLDMKNEAPEDAVTRFTAARDSFTELYMSEDPFVRFNAAYNAANCSSAIAKNSIALGQHEETVAAFESAIGEYEGLLDRNPEHEGVRQNLNHMRYLLKTLLQNPPPEQEQESGEGDEEDQEQEGDEENEQEQESSDQQQDGDPNEEQDSEEEQESAENPQEFNSSADENQEEAEPLNRQNIEAILQSLEDQDREEQKKLRRAKEPPRVINRKWW